MRNYHFNLYSCQENRKLTVASNHQLYLISHTQYFYDLILDFSGSEAHISPMQVLSESKDLASSGKKLEGRLAPLSVALLVWLQARTFPTTSSVIPS